MFTERFGARFASFLEAAETILTNHPNETDSFPNLITKTKAIPADRPSDTGFTRSFGQLRGWRALPRTNVRTKRYPVAHAPAKATLSR